MQRVSRNCVWLIVSGAMCILGSGCGPSSDASRPASSGDQEAGQGILTGAKSNGSGPTRRASARTAGRAPAPQETEGRAVILNEVVETFQRIKDFHDAVNSASKATKSDVVLVLPSHTGGRARE